MKIGVFRLNSTDQLRWLSFSPLQDFKLFTHGLIIKSREQDPSTLVKKNTPKSILKKIYSEEKHVIVPQQVHGNNCIIIKKGELLKKRYKGDAILTDRKDILLTISVADCLPIFLIDSTKKVIGLVHAGWRGTLSGIAKEAIRKAKSEFGCEPEDFTLLFGPAIQKCCYEISEGIAILFNQDCLTRRVNEKPKLDLACANLKQLLSCGVKEERIFGIRECTCCQEEMFHSFRRDGDEAGRMIAFLGFK